MHLSFFYTLPNFSHWFCERSFFSLRCVLCIPQTKVIPEICCCRKRYDTCQRSVCRFGYWFFRQPDSFTDSRLSCFHTLPTWLTWGYCERSLLFFSLQQLCCGLCYIPIPHVKDLTLAIRGKWSATSVVVKIISNAIVLRTMVQMGKIGVEVEETTAGMPIRGFSLPIQRIIIAPTFLMIQSVGIFEDGTTNSWCAKANY